MSKIVDELIEKRVAEKVLKYRKKAAERMLAGGDMPVSEIEDIVNLPIEVVEQLAVLQPELVN